MSCWTLFHFYSKLKKETPEQVIGILKFMIGKTKVCPQLPNHSLFETWMWNKMLQSDSAYFDEDTLSTLRYDKTMECYILNIRCNFTVCNDEIEKFIDWIFPYCDKIDDELLGLYLYEESEPVLIFYKNDYVIFKTGFSNSWNSNEDIYMMK